MKLNQPLPRQGSFANKDQLTAQMQEARQKQEKAAEAKERTEKVVEESAGSAEEWPLAEDVDASSESQTDKSSPEGERPGFSSPLKTLREMGIEPSEEDFHNLIFRGYIEKEVEIVKNPVSKKPLTARLKALTAEEVDLVDELLIEELDGTRMSNEGLEARRSVWLMSVAVQKLSGRDLVKSPPLDQQGKTDAKALAKAKRAILVKLNPYIMSRLVQKHAALVSCFNALLNEDVEGDILKK